MYVHRIERAFVFVKEVPRSASGFEGNGGPLPSATIHGGNSCLWGKAVHPLDRLRETRLLPVVIGLAIVAVALFLMRIAYILPPFLWAAITAYLLFPLVARLERRLRIPRALIIAGIYVFLIGLLVFLGLQVVPTVFDQVQSLVRSLPKLVQTAREELMSQPRIGIGGLSIDTAQVNARLDEIARDFATRFGREAVPLVLHTVGILINTLVYLLATYYFLLQGDQLIARLRSLAPPRHHQTVDRITKQVNDTFGAYIRAQLVLFVIVSVATFIGLSILHVEYALVLGIATGLLELVPVIGPWVAAIIAMIVALAQGSAPFGWTPLQLALVVGLMYLAIRLVEDQLVIPQLVGRIVRLHPLLVIFGVLAGASLGGALGLVLAVPTVAAIKIIVLAVLEELRHPPARRVVPLRRPQELHRFAGQLAEYDRQHVVLLVAPGAIAWDDLGTAQTVAAEALLRDIRLQVVTPDRVAASIATAAGIEVVTRVTMDEEAGLLAERPDEATTAQEAQPVQSEPPKLEPAEGAHR